MELPSIFEGLSARQIEHAMRVFRVIDVEAGVRIIEPGDQDSALVVVASGDLQLLSSTGVMIGRAGAGDVVGEMAFFGDGVRRLAVGTRGTCRLLVVDEEGYRALRTAGHPVAVALEERALACLEDRFATVCTTLAQLGDADLQTLQPAEGLVDRLFSLLGMGPTQSRVVATLEAAPIFRNAPRDALVAIASHLAADPVRKGEMLLSRGDAPERFAVIASGAVDLYTVTGPGRGHHVATLSPGSAFGLGALLPDQPPSAVTVVARERSVLLGLDPMKWAEVGRGADEVGSVLRLAAIRAGAAQLWRAVVLLSGLTSADSASLPPDMAEVPRFRTVDPTHRR